MILFTEHSQKNSVLETENMAQRLLGLEAVGESMTVSGHKGGLRLHGCVLSLEHSGVYASTRVLK